VHIVTEYGVNIVEVADRVRAAVQAAVTSGATTPQVDVYIDDVEGSETLASTVDEQEAFGSPSGEAP
jgi:uncharacterized alkaline shock family protein YloU